MGVVYKKELKGYFNGMMGYVFVAFSLIIIGVYSYAVNFLQVYPNFEYVLDSVRFLFVLLFPILTMRTVSEERRQRTDQLLYSSPISTSSVILGKFFASLTVFAIPMGISCFYPILLSRFGNVNFKTAYAGIFAFLLMGAACIAIGIFLSSLTENQMIAAVISFGVLLGTFLMPSLANMVSASAFSSAVAISAMFLLGGYLVYLSTRNIPVACLTGGVGIAAVILIYIFKRTMLEGSFNAIMNSLSVFARFDSFIYGIFDLTAVCYFITVTALFVFFTVQAIEKRRWS